jgi:hypothetical protein
MGKYKKMVKASVEEARQEVASGSEDPFVKAKADYTKKDIRLEAKNLRKTGSEIKRTDSPLAKYKCSYNSKKKSKKSSLTKTAFGSLSVEAGIDNNHNATQADRIVGAKKNK